MVTPSIVLISDPEIELIYITFAFEARSFPGLAVHDEAALRTIHHPVAFIASGAHRSERPTYFSKWV